MKRIIPTLRGRGPPGFQPRPDPLHCHPFGPQVFSSHAVALSRASTSSRSSSHPWPASPRRPSARCAAGWGRMSCCPSSSLRRPSAGGSAPPWRARSSRRWNGRSGSRSTAPIPPPWREAARLITEHYRPEFIDINFGCPVKKVVQRNGGIGLPPRSGPGRADHPGGDRRHPPARHGEDPERLERRAARPGGHRARMQDAGARAFTLHARTRTQMFSRQGRLGRDRPRGRGARHSGHRQRRHHDRGRTSCACGTTPAAPGS